MGNGFLAFCGPAAADPPRGGGIAAFGRTGLAVSCFGSAAFVEIKVRAFTIRVGYWGMIYIYIYIYIYMLDIGTVRVYD